MKIIFALLFAGIGFFVAGCIPIDWSLRNYVYVIKIDGNNNILYLDDSSVAWTPEKKHVFRCPHFRSKDKVNINIITPEGENFIYSYNESVHEISSMGSFEKNIVSIRITPCSFFLDPLGFQKQAYAIFLLYENSNISLIWMKGDAGEYPRRENGIQDFEAALLRGRIERDPAACIKKVKTWTLSVSTDSQRP